MPQGYTVRKAVPSDSESIYELICELAEFEKAPAEVINTPQKIRLHGWGENPAFICWVAEVQGSIVGMALCYVRYSTWKGPVLYLEDLIVTEAFRGRGIGRALFETCLQYTRDHQFHRMSWQVLDWNQSAIDFYKNYGATFDHEWVNCAITVAHESLE